MNRATRRALRKWQREALDLYDQHEGKVFLLHACMAAGKTKFIGEVVDRELRKGNADAIVVVVPAASLRKQMADDFHEETGIQLDPNWNGSGVPLVHGDFKGVVVTYQWLALNSTVMRNKVGRQSTLVILDEIHHAEEEKSWGNALRNAFEPANKLLLTTGTPFRSNGNPIAFVNYDKDGKAIPNYSYNYGQALSDSVVRAVFFNHHKGVMEWNTENGKVAATFEEKLNKKGESQRLRTALMWDGEHIGELLKGGIHKVQELRKEDDDAALLIIAMDQDHAKKLANRVRQEYGLTPILCISEDGDAAANAISAFKNSKEACIIAVRMISEGVSIPRIRVIVYATNIVADLFFMQAMGRGMRTELDHDDPTAWVFIPDDMRLHAMANELTQAREDALSKHEKRPGSDGPDEPPIPLWFQPLSATFSDVSATVNGLSIAPAELHYAETLKSSKPVLASFSREHIATILKGIGFDFSARQGETQENSTSSQPKPEKPLYEKLEYIRKQNHLLTGRVHYVREVEFQDIHNRLNAAVGISTVKTCSDLSKLQRRFDLALRWLKDGIEPEVSFND